MKKNLPPAASSSGLVSSPQSLIGLAVAAALMTACNFGNEVKGVVAGSYFTPATSTAVGFSKPSLYAGAKVCVDLNGNGVCDPAEPNTTTNSAGAFTLRSAIPAPLVAEIPTTAINGNHAVTQRTVLRAPLELIAEKDIRLGVAPVVAITPMSTEVTRLMESEQLAYATAKDTLSERLGVSEDDLLSDPNHISDSGDRQSLTNESTLLTNRFALATRMYDRHDVSPAALAANPSATRPAINMKEAEQAAMNVEGIPRYDNIFIVMLENKATTSIANSPYAPHINAYLQANNQFTNYFATGNPSEPNYTALGGADDFGITDDNQWNCGATGANAVQDLPEPTSAQPGLAKSPFSSPCAQSTNHNIVGRPNLFNAVSGGGLTWRTYNESTNPGQDLRTDSVADSAVVVPDHLYAPGTLNSNAAPVGNPNLGLPLPAGLYKTKHNPAMAFQNVRSAPEFKASNRTLGGGQWDPAFRSASDYAIPPGFDLDQFGTDLNSGDVGNLNYVIPDQCDDMHSIAVTGTDSSTGQTGVAASDCVGVSNGNHPAPNDQKDNIIARGDNYVKYLVDKIQASPLWQNHSKRVAIVLMFDEGSATGGVSNSCCGWNPGNSTVAQPLVQNPDGTFSPDTTVANYAAGNRGHGNSIFAVLTNQPKAPKGIKDSDAYSHFSFVRTLQDMFGVSDPKVDSSYMNRSKYTESFIAANILSLPEFASSADTHYDAVRPMNHTYVIPGGFIEKQSIDASSIQAGTQPDGSGNPAGTVAAQIGPDPNQTNIWALK